jgi:hypothetical protein
MDINTDLAPRRRAQKAVADSPYVAFTDDRERKWALVSRDLRWVLVVVVLAVADVPGTNLRALWRFVLG